MDGEAVPYPHIDGNASSLHLLVFSHNTRLQNEGERYYSVATPPTTFSPGVGDALVSDAGGL